MARIQNSTGRRPRWPAVRSLGWRRVCVAVCLICLASRRFGKGTVLLSFSQFSQFSQFVAIPICHGASASLNQLARAQLEGSGMSIRATKGRWYLEASDVDRSNLLEDLRDVRHVRSIRRIISCFNCTSASEDFASLVKLLDEGTDWDSVLADLDYLRAISKNGQMLKPISSFCVVCKKLSKLRGAELSELQQELAQCLQRRLGWLATGRGSALEVHFCNGKCIDCAKCQ